MKNVATNSAETKSPETFSVLARQLEGCSAENILRWASSRYSDRLTFATGFGAEGCILIDLIGRNSIPIDLFTLDTGLLFDETYKLWHQLESRYGITTRAVTLGLTVTSQASAYGDKLWKRDSDRCCGIPKVAPLEDCLMNVDAWISAIRLEQTPQRADAKVIEWNSKFGIVKINPLVRWTKKDVWRHIESPEVPYNPLHNRGYPSIGCWPCTSRIKEGEDERAGRWRGSTKTECGLHEQTFPNRQEH